MKKRFFAASLYVMVAMLAVSCKKELQAEAKPDTFIVVNPVVKDTTYTREFVAAIQSVQNIEVRARVSGFLEKIYVDEGSVVKQGQLLISITNRELNEELAKARAEYKSAVAESKVAEVELKNTKLLAEQDIVSQSELDMSKARLDAAMAEIDQKQSELNAAQIKVSQLQIRAPFSGVINRLPLKHGSLIDEGTLLTTLSGESEAYAYFNLSESEYLSFIKSGKDKGRVQLMTADGHLYPHEGIIETLETEVHNAAGGISGRARFANPKQWLRHGASGKILLPEALKNAMIIPQKSTFEIQGNTYVYVVDANNKVVSRKVEPAIKLPNVYILSSGLAANEMILYEGIQLVQDGDTIVPEVKGFENLLAQK